MIFLPEWLLDQSGTQLAASISIFHQFYQNISPTTCNSVSIDVSAQTIWLGFRYSCCYFSLSIFTCGFQWIPDYEYNAVKLLNEIFRAAECFIERIYGTTEWIESFEPNYWELHWRPREAGIENRFYVCPQWGTSSTWERPSPNEGGY